MFAEKNSAFVVDFDVGTFSLNIVVVIKENAISQTQSNCFILVWNHSDTNTEGTAQKVQNTSDSTKQIITMKNQAN